MSKTQYSVIIFSLLFMLYGCGKSDGNGTADNQETALVEEIAEGKYRAVLRSMNNHLSGYVPLGFAEIQIEGNVVKVKTQMHDDAQVIHVQAIQMGTRCPTQTDDKNGDRIIDLEEAYSVSGEVFIPLDADLESAEKGAGVYPKGRGYTYLESTELKELEADAKSRTGQNLNLGGRVILIHGAEEKAIIPETVSTRGELSAHGSIPVACGVIARTTE